MCKLTIQSHFVCINNVHYFVDSLVGALERPLLLSQCLLLFIWRSTYISGTMNLWCIYNLVEWWHSHQMANLSVLKGPEWKIKSWSKICCSAYAYNLVRSAHLYEHCLTLLWIHALLVPLSSLEAMSTWCQLKTCLIPNLLLNIGCASRLNNDGLYYGGSDWGPFIQLVSISPLVCNLYLILRCNRPYMMKTL